MKLLKLRNLMLKVKVMFHSHSTSSFTFKNIIGLQEEHFKNLLKSSKKVLQPRKKKEKPALEHITFGTMVNLVIEEIRKKPTSDLMKNNEFDHIFISKVCKILVRMMNFISCNLGSVYLSTV